jgi:uncharacterized membrane protein (Fun14 family)
VVSYVPDLSLTFVTAVVVPLVLGFIVGIIIKSVLKIGVAIAAIIILLMLLGVVTPSQILTPLASLLKSGSTSAVVTAEANRLSGYLPWSSLTFVIGVVVGVLKG